MEKKNKFSPGDNVIRYKDGVKYKVIGENGKSRIGDGPWVVNYDCCRLRKDGVRPDRRTMEVKTTGEIIGRFLKYRFPENELMKI